jgi:hypothetical protein
MNRLLLLTVALLASVAGFACDKPSADNPAATAPAAQKIRLQLNWKPEPQFGGFYQADLDGLFARVVQHEFDHLEGRLFTDRLPEAAALEVRRSLESFREVFFGKQSRGELPGDDLLIAELDRLEAARCQA